MISQATIAALRTTPPTEEQERELKASMRDGWWPDHPAIRDEHGVVLMGNRRLRIARELGIAPVIETITFGDGEEADDRRIKRALSSNAASAGTTAADRKALAILLATTENWGQERIARIVGVSQSSVRNYLRNLVPPTKLPPREEKRGRPKGSGLAPKPIDAPMARVSPIGKAAEPIIDLATLSMSAQQKLEVHKRRLDRENEEYKRQLKQENEVRYQAESIKRDDIWLDWELEEFRKAVARNHNYRGFMTKAQYNNLRFCLHEDIWDGIAKQIIDQIGGEKAVKDAVLTVMEKEKKRLSNALRLVLDMEDVLVKEDRGAPPLPDKAEMMRRRDEVSAGNRARAQRAAATRKANAAKQAGTGGATS